MSIESLRENAEYYVFSTNGIPSSPYISVNMATIAEDALESAITTYLGEADDYANAHIEAIAEREYLSDRLQKDIAGECAGMTDGGINYVDNTVAMHVKADDVFGVAMADNRLTNSDDIRSIIDNYTRIHSAVCMDDAGENPSLVSAYAEAATYDEKAVTISVSATDHYFINDRPNATGTNRTFTAYAENDGAYEPLYLVSYNEEIPVIISGSISATARGWAVVDAETSTVITYAATLEELISGDTQDPSSEPSSEEGSSEVESSGAESSGEEESSEAESSGEEESSETESSGEEESSEASEEP